MQHVLQALRMMTRLQQLKSELVMRNHSRVFTSSISCGTARLLAAVRRGRVEVSLSMCTAAVRRPAQPVHLAAVPGFLRGQRRGSIKHVLIRQHLPSAAASYFLRQELSISYLPV